MDHYLFTPAERAYFSARLQELNTQQLVLRHAVSLVIGQQSLDGTWRVADDGSGLVRVEATNSQTEPPATQ